jgi:hypothetical protein
MSFNISQVTKVIIRKLVVCRMKMMLKIMTLNLKMKVIKKKSFERMLLLEVEGCAIEIEKIIPKIMNIREGMSFEGRYFRSFEEKTTQILNL